MTINTSRGFTLLEVLIAVLVLSLGLLGLAGLQAYSMRYNQSANYRTQATNLASQFMDIARSYRGAGNTGQDARNHPNIRRLVAGLNSFSDGGTMSLLTACNATGAGIDPIRCDRARWFNALRTQLPNGRARVVFAGMPSGAITVEICWTDDRNVDTTQTPDCTGASEGYGRASVGADGTSNWPNNAVWLRSAI
ncbi:type IV pilus modification protein PilV [Denitratimonas sp. CY0512]|uniref:type IV pilus modification protein PilV n=1 Tax=Denitratimonas sp. CY0512 TaxID=3131940 RepID=UPI003095E65E